MSTQAIISKLQYAAELFHYANKFRGQTFIILFKDYEDFFNLVSDLKALHKAQINLIIALEKQKDFKKVQNFCRYDLEFCTIEISKSGSIDQILHLQQQQLCPIVNLTIDSTVQFIKEISRLCPINKLIFSGYFDPIKVDGKIRYYLTRKELAQIAVSNPQYGILASYVVQIDNTTEIVLIGSRQGSLFQEIFSYLGSGTLITTKSEISFSKARLDQVPQIFYILSSYVQDGTMLPIPESEIVKRLNDFFVLEIDSEVIGVVSIKIYKDWAELAKLCTLPRYRQKGLAGKLIEQVINYCKNQKLSFVFALSKNDSVISLFKTFGFVICKRETLPDSWKKTYDFSRPSKACVLKL